MLDHSSCAYCKTTWFSLTSRFDAAVNWSKVREGHWEGISDS